MCGEVPSLVPNDQVFRSSTEADFTVFFIILFAK